MPNKINSLEIKKYIIAKFGVDPTPIFEDKFISRRNDQNSAKRAWLYLQELKAKYDQSSGLSLEQYISQQIKEVYERSRGKRFATYLLRVAKANKLIGPETYKQIRESWGFTEYDEDIENGLKQAEERPDPFDLLINN